MEGRSTSSVSLTTRFGEPKLILAEAVITEEKRKSNERYAEKRARDTESTFPRRIALAHR